MDFIITGPILGVIAGFVLSYFVQTRTQRRAWKRDFLIKNIDTIYGPLYNVSLYIEMVLNSIDITRSYETISREIWEQIKNSYTYHMIDDELRKEIENFYILVELFNNSTHYAKKRAIEVVRQRASEFYDVQVENIDYRYRKNGSTSSALIFDCLLFKIHPKDAITKTDKIELRIEHRVGNEYQSLVLTEPEQIKEFDILWEKMSQELKNDEKIVPL